MYRLVLLDIDDTLYDAKGAYRVAEERVFREVQRRYPLLTWELFTEYYRRAREDVHRDLSGTASMHNRFLYFQTMMEMLGLTLEPRFLLRLTHIYWSTVYRVIKPFPGVKRTLRILKEHNKRTGVVTDLLAHIQAEKLDRLGVSRYIDFMVSSEETGREKPHPSMFLTALHKARVHPEEAVMVGDNVEKDVLGAKAVGITGILFGGEDPRADHSISSFPELVGIVLRKRRRFKRRKYLFINAELWEDVEGVLEKIRGFHVLFYGNERRKLDLPSHVRTLFLRGRVDVEYYERLLEITKVRPWNVAVVDPHVSHLRAARHLMMKTVLWGEWKEVFIPDYFVRSGKELLEVLPSLL